MNPAFLQAPLAAYEAGRFDQCVQLCRQFLVQAPDNEALLTLLGTSLWQQGVTEEASQVFRRLALLRPDVPEYWSNAAVLLRDLQRLPEAEDAFRTALSLVPRDFDILLNYGLLLLDAGRVAEARLRFLDAVEAQPESLDARILAASACFECGDAARAELWAPHPGSWAGANLDRDMRNRLVLVLIQVGRLQEAETLLQSGEDAADPASVARLALLYERTNRLELAAPLLERIRHLMADQASDVRSDVLSVETALALRDKDYARAQGAIDELLRMPLPPQTMANTHFTAASIADKRGDVEGAMRQAQLAHDIYFRIAADIVPEIVASEAQPLRIASQWLTPDEARFPRLPSDPSADRSPVFIVGFPRSGTTMLEQMLDAHPRFASMDERMVIQKCVEHYERQGGRYPEGLQGMSDASAEELRALYWSEVRKVVDLAEGQVLVDKNPLNMLRLPMIRRLFPDARIILALRHPCDVVLSCYLQNFRSPAFMVLCSSLERLSKSYVNAMRFWIHHQPLLCPDALLLRYEDTVTAFPSQVDRIADYLGIDDQAYLGRFSEHAAAKGYISTPSYSQVIEPVNTRAMGRWHAYRHYFEPVLPILQPIAEHWGYGFERA
jgi:tetratricopeptide (TPR) repeat protein